MSGLRLDCGSNIRGPTETVNTRQSTTTSILNWRSNNLVSSSISRPACHYQSNLLQPLESLNTGLAAYLDLALIFLLLRFSLLILFFLHLALIALSHLSCRSESSNKSL